MGRDRCMYIFACNYTKMKYHHDYHSFFFLFVQHFLQLHFFKKQFEAVESATDKGKDVSESIGEVEGTIFDEAVALLQRLEKELINEISDSVALDVKAKSRAYRTDKYELLLCMKLLYINYF